MRKKHDVPLQTTVHSITYTETEFWGFSLFLYEAGMNGRDFTICSSKDVRNTGALSPQETRLFIPLLLQLLIYKNIQIYMKTLIFLLSFTSLNTSCHIR